MRRYITEKVGILEIFQIIIAVLALSLGYYAFGTDALWNESVDKHGINICIDINLEINRHNTSILQVSECTDRLDIKNAEDCEKHINEFYLKKRENKHTIQVGDKTRNMKKFIETNMRRRQASETSFLVTMTFVVIILVGHLLLATLLNEIDLRTKWNAAVEGCLLFACGFSAMLLAVAVNTIDNKYIMVSNEIQVCGMLRFCDRSSSSHPELSKESAITVSEVLTSFHACQDVHVKESICILSLILVGTCVTMILLAMDLTTKYEQETEEQEVIERETTENIESLFEDQNVVFDNSQDPNAAQEIVAPVTAQTTATRVSGWQHLKSGSTVIAEYLGKTRPH